MGQGFKVYSSSELYCKWPKVAETMTEAGEGMMNEHSEEEKLHAEISRLQDEISDLQKIFYTARGIALAAALLVTGYLGYTQFIQLPGAMRDAIPKAVESSVQKALPKALENSVPKAVDTLLPVVIEKQVEDYVNQRADVFSRLDEIQSQILVSEKSAIDSAAAIDSILNQVQSSQSYGQSYGTCKWVDVGYEKSHEKLGDWCEAGSFLTQIDLASSERTPGSWPVIEQARCCTP
jgi:predicted RND superfamily exporter protein